jgi:hypothetical protein
MNLLTILMHLVAGIMLKPQLKDDGDFAGNTYLDCQNLDAVLVLAAVGDTDAAVGSTDEATPPYLEECDTSGGSYTKITGSDQAAVIGATDDNKIYGWIVDRTKTRKRYLRVNAPHSANGDTGANMTIIGLGFPAHDVPITAAKQGLAALIKV